MPIALANHKEHIAIGRNSLARRGVYPARNQLTVPGTVEHWSSHKFANPRPTPRRAIEDPKQSSSNCHGWPEGRKPLNSRLRGMTPYETHKRDHRDPDARDHLEYNLGWHR